MTHKERLTELLKNAKEIASSDPESSLKNVLELYSELKESNDYDSIGKLCKLIGTIYLQNSQTLKAKEYYTQAISNFELVGNHSEMGNVYNNLVITAYYLHIYEKVEEYSNLALKYFEISGEAEGVISVANNLSKYYRNIGATEKAYSLVKSTLSNYEDIMPKDKKSIMLAGYANISINIGNTEEGLNILLELSQEYENSSEYEVFAMINLYLTEYYESIGDYESALVSHKKRHNSSMLGREENISNNLNKYLHSFNIDVDRIQYDRVTKQNEELLQANSAVNKKNGFLQTLIDTIPLPLYYLDLGGHYLGVNDAYTEFFEVDKKKILGKKIGFSLEKKEDRENIEKIAEKLREEKGSLRLTTSITKSGNDTRTIELFNNIFSNENGEYSGMLGMLKDVTQEIEQQQQIKDVNAHLKSILESAPQVYICSIDRNYLYRYFNKNYADAVKRHIGKTITKGSNYFLRYKTETEIREKKKLLARVFSGEVISGIREYDDVNPPEILQYFYSPIVVEDGQVIGITVFSYDITERVMAQRELALSNKTKDKFFSIIAHDLRSPIGNIKSALEYITTEDELSDDEIMDMLDRLSHSAINTYDLLENLLQWSLTQRGLLENNSVSYWLLPLIEDAIKLSRNIAHSKGIDIQVTCCDDIKVFVDNNMFFTILRNLLTNAIKYSFKNSTIKVEVEGDKEYVLINVIDKGVGIKPEVIPYLNQMDKTITTYGTAGEKGSGLGLVLCNDLVKALGGKIWVESEEDKGSTFSFTLPTQERF